MPTEPRVFLESLFADKPDELYLLIWTLPEKESRWFRNVEDAIHCADAFPSHDVYVGLGLAARDYGPKRRCPSEEVSGIVGICADLDLRSDAHPKPMLPETAVQALSIIPPELPPSFVILTGNGLQVWWLFREPYVFDSEDERGAATALMNRWHTFLRHNASQRGWTYDRLADLARVLRVPGTTNCKDPSNPKPVVIKSHSERRYNPSELVDYLDDLAVPDAESEAAAAQEWARRFHDKPLTINLSARIPEDRINGWLETEQRFKDTWFRQRHDLHDQSQSGYDLALACFGFDAGLSEQEIVELIVQHRALHKQKQRTRLDYFQRTITKAASRTNGTNGFGRSNGPDGPLSSAASQHSNAPVDKATICKMLSGVLRTQIQGITKISGQSPIYLLDLAEGRVEFSDVGKLLSQTAMRNKLAGITGKMMRRFNSKEWEKVAQALLDACVTEEGGEEMEMEGAARLRLIQYISATPFIDSIERQDRDNARKPMVANGSITVCSSDIQTFINKTTSENVTIPTVVGMLSAVGAKSERFRGKFPEQSRWLLPSDKFSPADYVCAGE
jgi:hypothetical protein